MQDPTADASGRDPYGEKKIKHRWTSIIGIDNELNDSELSWTNSTTISAKCILIYEVQADIFHWGWWRKYINRIVRRPNHNTSSFDVRNNEQYDETKRRSNTNSDNSNKETRDDK